MSIDLHRTKKTAVSPSAPSTTPVKLVLGPRECRLTRSYGVDCFQHLPMKLSREKGLKIMRHVKSFAVLIVALLAAGSSYAQGVSITERLRGISQTSLNGYAAIVYGTGVLETWRWVDGREVVRVLIFQDAQKASLITSKPTFRTDVTFKAECGSQSMLVAGWGRVEMYSSDPEQRNRLVQSAGAWETDKKDVTITRLQDGTMELWFENVPNSTSLRGYDPLSCSPAH
jgi:hypothetical protein